jgi:hypothetical protein
MLMSITVVVRDGDLVLMDAGSVSVYIYIKIHVIMIYIAYTADL